MTESEEKFCELPDISIDSFGHNTSNVSKSDSFVMPAADELASQRERELLCEQELRALHVPRCDSSGSESEAALAAAVMSLRVHPAPAPAHHALSVSALLNALLPYLPTTDFLHDYLHLYRQTDPHTFTTITDDMVSSVCAMLACESNAWSDEEAVVVGAWLCALSVAGAARHAEAARALRVLLDERMSAAQVAALRGALLRAPGEALLPLADALAGAAQGCLAAALWDAALAHALGLQEERFMLSTNGHLVDIISSKWSALDAAERYMVVQAVGRCLAAGAAGAGEEGARLLRVLARTIPASHRHHPDYLKVLAGASKLQLLFGSKK